jgi:hypothetical protein
MSKPRKQTKKPPKSRAPEKKPQELPDAELDRAAGGITNVRANASGLIGSGSAGTNVGASSR